MTKIEMDLSEGGKIELEKKADGFVTVTIKDGTPNPFILKEDEKNKLAKLLQVI